MSLFWLGKCACLRYLTQWRTFVEIIGGDELLQRQLKRQNRVNFWGAPDPPSLLFARFLVSNVLRL